MANYGTATVTASTLSGNSAIGQNGTGGGIENSGTLTITASSLNGNLASGTTDGGSGIGGGIDNSGTVSVADSTLSGNSATGATVYFDSMNEGDGGAINNSGMATLIGCTLSANSATAIGSTSTALGGGINNTATLSVINSTFEGNSAGNLGGAIASSDSAALTYVTADDNTAAAGGGIGTAATSTSSVVTSIDSIYQNPQDGNVSVAAGSSLNSMGHNLFSDTPAVTLSPTDLVNTDPLLGSLADNGGPTFTQALLAGSPALNAGVAVTGITTDQRGAPRPAGSAPDIGAFEVQPPLTVVSLQPHGKGHKLTSLVIDFNLPLDPLRAQSLASYALVQTANGRSVPIRTVQYSAATQSVVLRPKSALSTTQTYQLTVIGTPPAGLTTTVGAYLAGAGPGQPGSNYVADFT